MQHLYDKIVPKFGIFTQSLGFKDTHIIGRDSWNSSCGAATAIYRRAAVCGRDPERPLENLWCLNRLLSTWTVQMLSAWRSGSSSCTSTTRACVRGFGLLTWRREGWKAWLSLALKRELGVDVVSCPDRLILIPSPCINEFGNFREK